MGQGRASRHDRMIPCSDVDKVTVVTDAFMFLLKNEPRLLATLMMRLFSGQSFLTGTEAYSCGQVKPIHLPAPVTLYQCAFYRPAGNYWKESNPNFTVCDRPRFCTWDDYINAEGGPVWMGGVEWSQWGKQLVRSHCQYTSADVITFLGRKLGMIPYHSAAV